MKGAVCNDERDVIRSQSECKTALEKLGYSQLSNWWKGVFNKIPSGCSIGINGNPNALTHYPQFETSAAGLGTGRGDLTPVCKMSPTFGNYSILVFAYIISL